MLKKIILVVLLSGLCFARSGLHFTEEDLSFEIADSVFSVGGIYYFSSDHAGKYSILYPFPEEDIFGKAYDIRVKNMETGEDIDFKTDKDMAFIRFLLKVDDDTPVYISYKQRLYTDIAKYILMTTHSWKETLGRVEYKLKLSPDIKIHFFSIPPDNKVMFGDDTLYLWQREDFMPETDLIFEFTKK